VAYTIEEVEFHRDKELEEHEVYRPAPALVEGKRIVQILKRFQPVGRGLDVIRCLCLLEDVREEER